MGETLGWAFLTIPAFILAGTVHEYMHAWTAKKLGDYTATIEGRLTLNPLVHLDPIGLLLMIFTRFGWMKPVPVNPYSFKHPVRDSALVAAAGPASNLMMAVFTAIFLRLFFSIFTISSEFSDLDLTGTVTQFIATFLYIFLWINVGLMVFNLIPLPPLDGSRIIKVFMPQSLIDQWEELEKFAPFILLAFFVLPPLNYFTSSFLSKSVQFVVGILI